MYVLSNSIKVCGYNTWYYHFKLAPKEKDVMHKSIRPSPNDGLEEDLEELQRNFFANEQKAAATVIRSTPPAMQSKAPKKESVFAQRRREAQEKALKDAAPMPQLEDVEMPDLESVPVGSRVEQVSDQDDGIDDQVPVEDPFPEPHVPVTKKMLDLTSMLGNILGQVKEHNVETVTAPVLPADRPTGQSSRRHVQGFPEAAHRSEFSKRMAQKKKEVKSELSSTSTKVNDTYKQDDEEDENSRRIANMSEQEIEEARQEIMGTLSPASIETLMNRRKNVKPVVKNTQRSTDELIDEEEKERIAMKETYFADVPMESDKLAWMKQVKEEVEDDKAMSSNEKVYRKLRFDLHGKPVNPSMDIPRHQGLHHHGDEPEKAGYTLAELLHLVRSQVPSQRAIILTTIGRIIQHSKKCLYSNNPEDSWAHEVMRVLLRPDLAITLYLRSALDDRSLVVQASAIEAMAALVLDVDNKEDNNMEVFLGHVISPRTPPTAGSTTKVTGLANRFTSSINAIRNQNNDEDEDDDDAVLAEKDLIRGLIGMDILARIRYLVAPDSGLLTDPMSMERLVAILVRFAEAGKDVCEKIMKHELLERVFEWGIVNPEWPISGTSSTRPSLVVLRLMRVLAQGSKTIAKDILPKTTAGLPFLVVSPAIAGSREADAYELQCEMLRLLRVCMCYGLVMPIIEDLQSLNMFWLRESVHTPSALNDKRSMAVLSLLEVELHLAADPHKTTPVHAISWHQPLQFLPIVVSLLGSKCAQLQDCALGYLAAWSSYIDRFPPSATEIRLVWNALDMTDWSVPTVDRTLRRLQLLKAFGSIHQPVYNDLKENVKHVLYDASLVESLRRSSGRAGRLAFWLWISQTDESGRKQVWADCNTAEITMAVCSVHAGAAETWLAQALMRSSVLDRLETSVLDAFYIPQSDPSMSKALFEYDGRIIDTFMYPSYDVSKDVSVFLWSPIDELYHGEKSFVESDAKAADIIKATLKAASLQPETDRAVAIVSLMKIFLIGDREGRQSGFESEREVFWNVTKEVEGWLELLCSYPTQLDLLESAWKRSSAHIRQAHVSFYQFYQAFVGQYAAVSMGTHVFARLLAYVATELRDEVDYWHLLVSDYHDILRTIHVRPDEVANRQGLLDLQKHV
ncbi:hypothetical protein PHYBLDRAFT_167797 [Phycomyces blakesleeanus NRRL 1555(-)]|uniref:RNA polymerase II-associated protein 1 C-terminal domain-containing protein n=2 Tax=Phycomyces blakesleeanus TaxID=4837 RepID=A0A163ALW7_PHYB8|nr:hypothetical protein PHYBLDRAFT_167797 [Phycomyces blakesleeanus NRRL 1555(-)]OAD74381.1 hypothetical protein PHYBLDRAFT_167797 [Phycomyces blakesleeanus NRRL 1555(-)]|eukprot:XP_018292421.1 hypothetical protein PHYBLDRAFT_167797 [Phycomyces blakesleeanus NRRL 1555(-)]